MSGGTERVASMPRVAVPDPAPGADTRHDMGSDRYVEEFLYDLEADPYELTNLIGIESHHGVAARLRRRLIERMVEDFHNGVQIVYGETAARDGGASLAHPLSQLGVLRLEFGDVESPVDQQLERIGVDRLFVKIVSALCHGCKRVFLVAVTGDNDHLGVRRQLEGFRERRKTLLYTFGVRRQAEILQNDSRFVAT